MFANRVFAKSLFKFALGSILVNAVNGLPVTTNDDGKEPGVSKVQDVFYVVQCGPATWGTAQRCGAWCNERQLNFNRTECPIGGDDADDVLSDCYCVGECAICKDGDEAEHEDQDPEKAQAQAQAQA